MEAEQGGEREAAEQAGHRRAPIVGNGAPTTAPQGEFHLARGRHPRTAAWILATSIFCIGIIASKARFATAPPLAIASVRTFGVICQLTPHLSLHQPHWLSWPPFPTIAFQYLSVSA